MTEAANAPRPLDDPAWDERLRYWRRKLGRVRLGVEPVEQQLARYRAATFVLTAVPLVLALIIVSIFAAFGRPGIGAIFVLFFPGPIIPLAWLDHALLRARVAAYQNELREHEARAARP